jgi:hypothetical protein
MNQTRGLLPEGLSYQGADTSVLGMFRFEPKDAVERERDFLTQPG